MRPTLLLLLAVLTGCGATPTSQPPTTPATPTTPTTPAILPTPAPVATVNSTVNGTDAAWLQLMVPMHRQFLAALALAPTHAADPAVVRAAARLTVTHEKELAELVALRDQAALPTANQHEGHDMPGMMTTDEFHALEQLRGQAFDKTLARELTDHLRQSVLVARGVVASGHSPAVRALATRIVSGHQQELAAAGQLRSA